jgi:uncharacterized protein YfeS
VIPRRRRSVPVRCFRPIWKAPGTGHKETLEHVPKKLRDFFDSDMLQLFDFERVLIEKVWQLF